MVSIRGARLADVATTHRPQYPSEGPPAHEKTGVDEYQYYALSYLEISRNVGPVQTQVPEWRIRGQNCRWRWLVGIPRTNIPAYSSKFRGCTESGGHFDWENCRSDFAARHQVLGLRLGAEGLLGLRRAGALGFGCWALWGGLGGGGFGGLGWGWQLAAHLCFGGLGAPWLGGYVEGKPRGNQLFFFFFFCSETQKGSSLAGLRCPSYPLTRWNPPLDCYWVGSLDFNFLGNKGVFH